MRRSLSLLILFVSGCGASTAPDTAAARQFLERSNSYAENVVVEAPEYAEIANIPKRAFGNSPAVRPAACGVRVRFLYRDGSRTTRDDWVVWVSNEHKAIDFSGNADGDNWRQYVRKLAKE